MGSVPTYSCLEIRIFVQHIIYYFVSFALHLDFIDCSLLGYFMVNKYGCLLPVHLFVDVINKHDYCVVCFASLAF